MKLRPEWANTPYRLSQFDAQNDIKNDPQLAAVFNIGLDAFTNCQLYVQEALQDAQNE